MRWPFVVGMILAGCRINFDPVSLRGDAALLDGAGCPVGYQELGASCYRAVLDKVPSPVWLDAELDCEADAAGAHLAVIDDAAEAVLVRDLVTVAVSDSYIGATDIVTENMFLTVTDLPQPFLMWAASEPDGSTQNCLALDRDALVQDTDCVNPNNDYVCEYDGIVAVPAAYGQ